MVEVNVKTRHPDTWGEVSHAFVSGSYQNKQLTIRVLTCDASSMQNSPNLIEEEPASPGKIATVESASCSH